MTIQGLSRSMQHIYLITVRHISQTVCIVYLALSRTALLSFGRLVGFSSHSFYTLHMVHLSSSRGFVCCTRCVFQNIDLLDGSIMEVLRVSFRFFCKLFWWSLSYTPIIIQLPWLEVLIFSSSHSWLPSETFGKNIVGSIRILSVSAFPEEIRSYCRRVVPAPDGNLVFVSTS